MRFYSVFILFLWVQTFPNELKSLKVYSFMFHCHSYFCSAFYFVFFLLPVALSFAAAFRCRKNVIRFFIIFIRLCSFLGIHSLCVFALQWRKSKRDKTILIESLRCNLFALLIEINCVLTWFLSFFGFYWSHLICDIFGLIVFVYFLLLCERVCDDLPCSHFLLPISVCSLLVFVQR